MVKVPVMEGNQPKTLWQSLKRALAYYPLTLYFGLLLVVLSATFLYLNLKYGFRVDISAITIWVKQHQTTLLLLATLILGSTLIGSAIAYRQVANLSKEDYLIWLQQRSTRTFFPFFVPFHDWLRLRFAVYRWWHTQIFASTVHVLILIVVVGFSIGAINTQTRQNRVLLSPGIGCVGGGAFNDNSWRYAFGLIDPAYAVAIGSFTVTGISSPTTVGTANSVTVTAKDCDGNTKTDYVGTVHFTSSDGSATLPSNYTFVGGDSGVHTFTNGVTFATAGTQSVTVNDVDDPTSVGSQTGIVVNSAAAATLEVTGITDPVTAGTASSVTVTAKTAGGATATGYTGTITFTSNDGAATLPNNYTFVGGDNGTHTFTNGVTMKTAGERTVTATDTVTGSITGTQSNITVNPGAATTLTVAGITDPVTAGTASSVTVTAKDAYNNTATGYTGTVTFTSTDGAATLPNNYAFIGGDAGVHTFTNGVTMKTAGERTVTATDTVTGSITGTQSNITVNPGAATTLTVAGITDPVTAGTASSVTVTAKDAYNNTATGYSGTITFTSSDGQAVLPSNYAFVGGDSGVHTFTGGVTMKTAGEQTVTATDTITGSITGTQSAITVNPGTATALTVTGITDPVTAGTASNMTVTAKDAYNNTATGYSGTITFTSSDGQAVLPSNYTFVGGDSGVHTFTNGVTMKTAGERTVTATDTVTSSITGTQSAITVNPGSAQSLAVTGISSPVTAGTASDVTVTAKDAYSNTATGYTGTITFTSSDSAASLPSNYTFVGGDSGAHTFSSGVTLKTAGTQSVTATDTGTDSITGSQSAITVNAADATRLTMAFAATTVTAGTQLSPVVTAYDNYNNIATGFDSKVVFSSSDGQATLPSDYVFVFGDAGKHTFTNEAILKTAGSKNITVLVPSGSRNLTDTTDFTVTAGAIDRYTLTTTTPQHVGTGWSETATAKDAYDNVVTNDSTTAITPSSTGAATFHASSAYTATAASYQLNAGVATLFIKDMTAQSLRVTVADSSGISATSGIISVIGPGFVETDPCDPASNAPLTSTINGSRQRTKDDCDTGGGTGGGGGQEVAPDPTTIIGQIINYLNEHAVAVAALNKVLAVIAPLATIAALAPVAASLVTTGASGGSFLNLLFLGMVPARKKKRWGVVKDSKTSLPIGGLFIELYAANGRKIARTMTDRNGQYGFLVSKPGDYYVAIISPLYEPFRSRTLAIANPAVDVIKANIALTPLTIAQTKRMKRVRLLMGFIRIMEIIHWPALIAGSVLAAYAYSQDVTIARALLLAFYAMLWASKALEFDYRRPFGVVLDRATNQPQSLAVVQLTADHNGERTVVHSTITDKKGRFLFVVRPRRYHLVAAKAGYIPAEKEIIGDTINTTVKLDRTTNR